MLLAFAKMKPEKPSDNECSYLSGTVVLTHVREGIGASVSRSCLSIEQHIYSHEDDFGEQK